jgi:hypothetical protein
MVAWMQAWAALPARTPPRQPVAEMAFLPSSPAEIPPEYFGQIAALLTSMFLETRAEVLS